nr:MAG TPA: hypothetical protein [Caudoviricetes sp.]
MKPPEIWWLSLLTKCKFFNYRSLFRIRNATRNRS